MPKKIIGLKRQEVTGGWRKFLICKFSFIKCQVIKSRRVCWVVHVPRARSYKIRGFQPAGRRGLLCFVWPPGLCANLYDYRYLPDVGMQFVIMS
jgi:hypothetical protein